MTSEPRCQATTASGAPCRAPSALVDPSQGLCPAHQPGASERLAEAGRKGAETTARKLRGDGLHPEELGALETVEDAQRWLKRIAQAVGQRQLTHSEGASMTRAVEAWIRSEDTRLRAVDLRELQNQIAELKRSRMRPA